MSSNFHAFASLLLLKITDWHVQGAASRKSRVSGRFPISRELLSRSGGGRQLPEGGGHQGGQGGGEEVGEGGGEAEGEESAPAGRWWIPTVRSWIALTLITLYLTFSMAQILNHCQELFLSCKDYMVSAISCFLCYDVKFVQ